MRTTETIADGHTVTGIEYFPARWECTCGQSGDDGSAGVDYHRRRLLTDLTDAEIDTLRELAVVGPASDMDLDNRDGIAGLVGGDYVDYVYRQDGCGCCGETLYEITDEGQELLARLDAS